MTDAELRLWYHLRAGRPAGVKFKRQHPMAPYVLDFVSITHRLIIELDGGQHLESDADFRRDSHLRAQGYTVLRFWNNDVLTDTEAVLERILTALSPTPLPQAGEGKSGRA